MGKRKAATATQSTNAGSFDHSQYTSKSAKIRAYNEAFPGKKQSAIARELGELTGEKFAQSQVAQALKGSGSASPGKRGRKPGQAQAARPAATQQSGSDMQSIRAAAQLIKSCGNDPERAKQMIDAIAEVLQ